MPTSSTTIDVIWFDIGGVLGTNGWDREERSAAVTRFGLEEGEFDYRHQEAHQSWEVGKIGIEEYLDLAVFWKPRAFSRDEFRNFMFAQSQPFPDSVALVRRLRALDRYRMMTLNNEAPELNAYRIDHFGLDGLFDAFFSSCYLAVRKPLHECYARALAMTHIAPERVVFIDDRKQNILPAQSMGIHTILFTSATDTARQLADFGVDIPSA